MCNVDKGSATGRLVAHLCTSNFDRVRRLLIAFKRVTLSKHNLHPKLRSIQLPIYSLYLPFGLGQAQVKKFQDGLGGGLAVPASIHI